MQIVTIICLKKHRNQLHDAAKDLYFFRYNPGNQLGGRSKTCLGGCHVYWGNFLFCKKGKFLL